MKGKIGYIGVTQSMKQRMNQHLTIGDAWDHNQIPKDKIDDIEKIEYTVTETFANARVLEAYLIAKEKPEYNKDFVEDDYLTYELITGDIKWHSFEFYLHDNPNHLLRVYDKWGGLLYQVPFLNEYYEPLAAMLGIDYDIKSMRHGQGRTDVGEYILNRISKNRRVRNGSCKLVPKYTFMGFGDDRQNANKINTVAK